MSAPAVTERAAEERLQEHYHDLERQKHAAQLGMWVFLASEVLFFIGLFTLYAAYRASYPQAFSEAVGHTDLWLGSANTYVLLAASLLVALAVHAVRQDRGRRTSRFLAWAALLGVLFLGLKLAEYWRHFSEGIYPGSYYAFEGLKGQGARVFFTLYYFMTGLHAFHVAGGIAILGWLSWRARGGAYTSRWHTPLELGGMYWHFVDMVWLFLWPMFYLMK